MKKSSLLLVVALVVLMACGRRQPVRPEESADAISLFHSSPGDSTLYGLACDGCTDSLLIFLPYAGGNPDTFDILEAQRQHRVYGRPHIGDEMALIPNPEQPGEAILVINLSLLQGRWHYMMTPTLRQRVDGLPRPQLPDSIRRRILAPHEYSLILKRDRSAFSLGAPRQTNSMSPVSYPEARHYTSWRISNGQLILRCDTIPGMGRQEVPGDDTVSIELLRRDTLVLRFADHEQYYYKKEK